MHHKVVNPSIRQLTRLVANTSLVAVRTLADPTALVANAALVAVPTLGNLKAVKGKASLSPGTLCLSREMSRHASLAPKGQP